MNLEDFLKKLKTRIKKSGLIIDTPGGIDTSRVEFVIKNKAGEKLDFSLETRNCYTSTYFITYHNPIPEEILNVAFEIFNFYAEDTQSTAMEFPHLKDFDSKDIELFVKYGFKRIPESKFGQWNLKKNFTEEELNSHTIWVKEVRKGIIDDMLLYSSAFQRMFEFLKNEDVTTSYRGEFATSSFHAKYYFQGEHSDFLLIPSKGNIEFFGSSRSEHSDYKETFKISSIEEVWNSLQLYFQGVEERRKLVNLVYAPREHFNRYFSRNSFIDALYEELLQMYDSFEVEEIVASGNLSHVSNYGVHLIRFNKHYILIENESMKIHSCSEKDIIVNQYKNKCLSQHKKVIEKSLSELEQNHLPYYMKQ